MFNAKNGNRSIKKLQAKATAEALPHVTTFAETTAGKFFSDDTMHRPIFELKDLISYLYENIFLKFEGFVDFEALEASLDCIETNDDLVMVLNSSVSEFYKNFMKSLDLEIESQAGGEGAHLHDLLRHFKPFCKGDLGVLVLNECALYISISDAIMDYMRLVEHENYTVTGANVSVNNCFVAG